MAEDASDIIRQALQHVKEIRTLIFQRAAVLEHDTAEMDALTLLKANMGEHENNLIILQNEIHNNRWYRGSNTK